LYLVSVMFPLEAVPIWRWFINIMNKCNYLVLCHGLMKALQCSLFCNSMVNSLDKEKWMHSSIGIKN
jgi:hypothetical protein